MQYPTIIACVLVQGPRKYTYKDVLRLKRMVEFYYEPGSFDFYCITDQPETLRGRCNVVTMRDSSLRTWWAKMELFEPTWRAARDVIYYDLDTVLVGKQEALLQKLDAFHICESFTKVLHKRHWPCNYGSCIMTIPKSWGSSIWDRFQRDKNRIIRECSRYGDQLAIQMLHPDAHLLQPGLPPDYIIGYRDLKKFPSKKPDLCSIVVYAGGRSPLSIGPDWIKKAWSAFSA